MTRHVEQRELVKRVFNRNFFVTAGAGTGKTTLLIERYLALVEKEKASVDQIVAITFTEKAAAELRNRIRGEIAKLLGEGKSPHTVEEAPDRLYLAPIQTIHAFCASILREYPAEAKIDPDYRVLEESPIGLNIETLWEEWLDREYQEGDPAEWNRITRHVTTVKELFQAASDLVRNREQLEHLSQDEEPVEVSACQEALGEFFEAFRTLIGLHYQGHPGESRLIEAVEKKIESALGSFPEELDAIAFEQWFQALTKGSFPPKRYGKRSLWKGSSLEEEVRPSLQAGWEKVVGTIKETRSVLWHNEAVFTLNRLRAFMDMYAERKRHDGLIDFHDMLLLTRELLRGDKAIRRRLQQRYRYILVDEFQDTDPLQAEIIAFLAEHGAKADRWQDVQLTPGKLFIVGDEKQSIYRFRRADVEVFKSMRKLITDQDGVLLQLQWNFRSGEGIIDWVNSACEGFLEDYEEIRPPAREADNRSVIEMVRLVRDDENRAPDDLHAEAVAEAIERARGDGLDYGGMAILLRRMATGYGRDPILSYTGALNAKGIPFLVIGGKHFYSEQEIHDVRHLLKTLYYPNDTLSLYATLRSPFFGFPDDILFVALRKNALDLFAERKNWKDMPWGDELADALAMLRELHLLLWRLPMTELLDRIYERTRIVETYALDPDGRQKITNLQRLKEQAALFGVELGQRPELFLSALERLIEQSAEAPDFSIAEEEDVVKVLTVHKAKGLEFDAVFFPAGWPLSRRINSRVLVDRSKNRVSVEIETNKQRGVALKTREHPDLLENEKSEQLAEARRLVYVAVTRAKRRLVVVGDWTKDPSPWTELMGSLKITREHFDQRDMREAFPSALRLSRFTPRDGAQPTKRERISLAGLEQQGLDGSIREVSNALSELRRKRFQRRTDPLWPPARTSLTSLLREEKGIPTTLVSPVGTLAPFWQREEGQERLTLLGTITHRFLANCDFALLTEPSEVRSQLAAFLREEMSERGGEPMLERRVLAFVDTLTAHSIYQRILEGEIIGREIPFLWQRPHDHREQRVDGVIDVLYQSADGALELLDWKTGRASEGSRHRYDHEQQVALYRQGIEAILNEPVAEASLFYLRTGELVVVEKMKAPGGAF